MNRLSAVPRLLKQANLTQIRRIIRDRFTATRAEIARETQISSTTVRTLLTEMLQSGEIESIGYDESSGGRKAERYRFTPGKYYGAAFCITGNQIEFLLVSVCGDISEISRMEFTEENFQPTLVSFLNILTKHKEIKSIGVGVAGVVENGGYIRKDPKTEALYRTAVDAPLKSRFGIPVVLENDINAAAIGFVLRRGESLASADIAYLHFHHGCLGAGFLSGGKIIRGCNNFAGELGLLPGGEGKSLEANFTGDLTDGQYCDYTVKILVWICGILNPKTVVLTGDGIRENCLGAIREKLFKLLPAGLTAQILYSPDSRQDYFAGMAALTASKMFDEIQLIKE